MDRDNKETNRASREAVELAVRIAGTAKATGYVDCYTLARAIEAYVDKRIEEHDRTKQGQTTHRTDDR